MADGVMHPAEENILERVGGILGVSQSDWQRGYQASHSKGSKGDYEVLGLEPSASVTEIKAAYRVRSIPTLVIVDPSGTVHEVEVGASGSADSMEAHLVEAIESCRATSLL